MSTRPVIRTVERVAMSELSLEQRTQLIDPLHSIIERSLSVDYLTPEKVFELYLSSPDMVVGLLRSDGGELVGFVGTRITTVEHERRTCAVFSAGVFCKLDYRGGLAAARFGLLEALRFKLRHPGRALAYLAVLVTPAPYVLHARVLRRLYPRVGVETPTTVEAWMQATAKARGLDLVGPGVASMSTWARDQTKPTWTAAIDDPDVRFYVERNPNWKRGEGLIVWAPLDLANVFASLLRWRRRA